MRFDHPSRVLWLVGAVLVSAACDKDGDPAPPAADPAATATATAAASPTAPGGRASIPPAPSAASAREHPLPISSASAAPIAHPLRDWMRGPATDAWTSGDLESIASAFEQMAAWAPSGYGSWASIAIDGSRAARIGSLDAVKAACRECHAQYEGRYRVDHARDPLPSERHDEPSP